MLAAPMTMVMAMITGPKHRPDPVAEKRQNGRVLLRAARTTGMPPGPQGGKRRHARRPIAGNDQKTRVG